MNVPLARIESMVRTGWPPFAIIGTMQDVYELNDLGIAPSQDEQADVRMKSSWSTSS